MRRIIAWCAAGALLAGCTSGLQVGNEQTTGSGGKGGTSTVSSATTGASAGGNNPGLCTYPFKPLPAAYMQYEGPQTPQCTNAHGLPCGACGASDPICQKGIHRDCCSDPNYDPDSVLSPFDGWLCACVDGDWSCWVSSEAAAECMCSACPVDEPTEGAACNDPGQSCNGWGSLSCPETATCAVATGQWRMSCPTLAFGSDAATCSCPHPGG